MYIDDFILKLKSLEVWKWSKHQLMIKFSMKDLGEAKTIMEWKIIQREDTHKINQKRYIKDLLESEKMTLCYSTVFPMKAGCILFRDQVCNH